MENVTTKSFGVGLEMTFIGGFGLDSSLVDSNLTQVWWNQTRLEFGGIGLDSSLVDLDSTRAFSNGLDSSCLAIIPMMEYPPHYGSWNTHQKYDFMRTDLPDESFKKDLAV